MTRSANRQRALQLLGAVPIIFIVLGAMDLWAIQTAQDELDVLDTMCQNAGRIDGPECLKARARGGDFLKEKRRGAGVHFGLALLFGIGLVFLRRKHPLIESSAASDSDADDQTDGDEANDESPDENK